MPQDAITISYIVKELQNTLSSGKVLKVTQPENDEINLQIYCKEGQKKLVLSSNSNSPRCHITNSSKLNPQNAPSFCMLLRKHLTNGQIVDVQNIEGDRIIIIQIQSKNEMQDNVNLHLIVELMSRQSNIILADNDMRILGSIKQFSLESGERQLFVGATYVAPPIVNKISPYHYDELKHILSTFKDGNVANFILENVSGLAYSTVAEILYRATTQSELYSLDENQIEKIAKQFEVFCDLKNFNEFSPRVSLSNGVPKEFYAAEYTSLSQETKSFETINDAVDFYYSQKDTKQRVIEHSKILSNLLKNAVSRNEKKLAAQLNQLEDCNDCEIEKIKGELITSNIYKIKQGDEFVVVNNYYDENSKEIKITLDKSLSPSKNAQNYYKRYAKKKRTIENVSLQIEETRATLDMLYQIRSNLKNIDSTEEIDLIKQDLINSGIMRAEVSKKGKKVKEVKLKPLEYVFDGYKIFVGRNSTENEFVTHKLGKNKDIWFHAKSNFGAHVIIKYENRDISDDAIVFCAELAGYYAASTPNEKVEIDYTEVKNVKKPPSGKLGLVIYNTNWSMLAMPNQHKENLLKTK
ncbi:MAG: NFACT RNA binding domain-containing protein [Clostridia bacterium]